MNNVDRTTQARSKFFPNTRTQSNRIGKTGRTVRKNSSDRQKQLEQIASKDAKINIPEAVRDFAKIRKAVDAAPEVDNSKKIADLKARIQNGTYKVDYEALADKILGTEF